MLLAKAVLALLTAHLLPGIVVVELLKLGRGRGERWLMAAVLGGPVAAAVHLAGLGFSSALLYWSLVAALDGLALFLLGRSPKRREVPSVSGTRPSRTVVPGLSALLVILVAAYWVTTGALFRLDADGSLVMDSTLQRDTLFHVGIVRSLESSYPPRLLSVGGAETAYHSGYHLQVAAWSRFYEIDVLDGLYRMGAIWSLALLVGSVFLLGRRFARDDGVGVAAAALIFGSGLGFLFPAAPGAGFWSLVFMDAAVVSVFLVNPLLAALPLLMVGMACLDDYLTEGWRGARLASAFSLASLLAIKMFLGVQVIAGVALGFFAARCFRRRGTRRIGRVALALSLGAAPFLIHTFFAAWASNTAIGLRPLEIVRYSLEKLGWREAISAVAAVGAGEFSMASIGLAATATVAWLLGFLGLRLLGLPRLLRDIRQGAGTLRTCLAFTALIGIPVALVFRIAPAEATGLSRLEAQNDVIWFAAQSGLLLWFWTAEVLVGFGRRGAGWSVVSLLAAAALAFPATLQHFFHKATLAPDRVPAPLVEASQKASELAAPDEIWVDPPERVRPSPIAYLAGRPVVYDAYVGFDYMFIPRDEIDRRRHAIAHFWQSEDPAFGAWFLERFDVGWALATTERPLPSAARAWLEPAYASRTCRLFRVDRQRLARQGRGIVLATPNRVPLGVRWTRFFGAGWSRPFGSPRKRRLPPGEAELYLPIEAHTRVLIRLGLETPHARGDILWDDGGVAVKPLQQTVSIEIPGSPSRGLQRIRFSWQGSAPLTVRRIDLRSRRDEGTQLHGRGATKPAGSAKAAAHFHLSFAARMAVRVEFAPCLPGPWLVATARTGEGGIGRRAVCLQLG